jgi:integrase
MPRHRSPRTRVERGIYRDAAGYEVVAHVGARRKARRYPRDTPLATMRAWQDATRLALRTTPAPRPTARSAPTLAADVDRYIAQVRTLVSWRELRAELRAWVRLAPQGLRRQLTPEVVRRARVTWLDAGVSPKTINHRVAALRRMIRTLDAVPGAPLPVTPCDGLRRLPVPRVPKIPITPDVILRVYRALLARERQGVLRTAKTRARYMVLATTGVRPSELMRAQPEDLSLDTTPPYWLTRDGKGGRRASALPLNPEMLEAWRVFVAAGAWGRYETSAFARTLRAAGWPADVRPYRLRATVGIELSARGIDLADVAGWLGHTDLDTTRADYVPVLAPRMVQAMQTLAGRVVWPTREEDGPVH